MSIGGGYGLKAFFVCLSNERDRDLWSSYEKSKIPPIFNATSFDDICKSNVYLTCCSGKPQARR